MAKIISACPRCETMNEVKNYVYMLLDKGTGVTCEKCGLLFCATLSDKDVEELSKTDDGFPHVEGKDDYVLKGERYPTP